MRELVRAPIELAVAQPRAFVHDGDGVGRPIDLRLEQLVEAAPAREVAHGGGVGQEALELLGRQQRQRRERAPRIRHDQREQPLEVARELLDERGVEEILVVREVEAEVRAAIPAVDAEIEHGRAPAEVDLLAAVGARRLLVDVHHLEQRRAAEAALEAERVDDQLERCVLVIVCRERVCLLAGEQRGERVVVALLVPQHERVDEHADQALDLGGVAVRDRGAEHDVGLTGVACEQRAKRRREHHEQRCTFGARELAQAGG